MCLLWTSIGDVNAPFPDINIEVTFTPNPYFYSFELNFSNSNPLQKEDRRGGGEEGEETLETGEHQGVSKTNTLEI